MTYAFPAIFEYDKEKNDGGYCVYFPDIQGCFTQGDNLKHAMDMAEDALCLALYSMEVDGGKIPSSSKVSDIKMDNEDEDNEDIVNLVACDTQFYYNYFANKSAKVNVTIPLWLKEEAERKKLNFSQILQQGVKQYLNLL